jgi:UDP-N-acetylmuramoylalanine--D-glutamate ligase
MSTPPHRSAARVSALSSWHADWAGLRVAVLGAGLTGFSVADTLVELGATPLVVAGSIDENTERILEVLGVSTLRTTSEDVFPKELDDFDPELVVVSPGFPPHHGLVRGAAERGIPVWGDVELAWRVRDKLPDPAEWITVTGTNGKTTTVQLTAAMLAAGGVRAAPAGNLGIPLLDAIRDPGGFDVIVVELSSFQLHYSSGLSPYASACLNLAADHLDWHGSFEAYRDAKASVYESTRVACVYNRDDEATRTMVEQADVVEGCRAIGFGFGIPGRSDFGVVDGILCDRAFLDDRRNAALEIVTVAELERLGLAAPHLVADVLAACALARSFGVGLRAIRSALAGFRPDHHRTEVVGEAGGVRWVDDSKATNPHAAEASLASFDSVVWVLGGLFKGASPEDLIRRHAPRLRGAVLIGADRSAARSAFARHAPGLPVFEVDTADTEEVMPSAVRLAAGLAVDGDVVLLAPAAASMDQFADYADRGTRFGRAVREILGGGDDDHEPSATPPRH